MTAAAHKVHSVLKPYINDQKPTIGIILGSGLSAFTKQISDAQHLPYADLPGFPELSISGHKDELILGNIHNTQIACCAGRVHFYEGNQVDGLKTMIRSLKLIGCDTLIITNATGSLQADAKPGELMLINDHINLQPFSPLTGPNDAEFGPRFVPMENAYDPELRKSLLKLAAETNIPLREGTYVAVSGPQFETPAEIRFFQKIGGDCIGMSTAPDVIIARHCGLKVICLSALTNLAAGLSNDAVTHEQTLKGAKIASKNLCQLLTAFIASHLPVVNTA